jgi:hypothetical protein
LVSTADDSTKAGEPQRPKAAQPQPNSNPNLLTPQRPNLQSAEKGIGFLCVSEFRVSAVLRKFRGLKMHAAKQQTQIEQYGDTEEDKGFLVWTSVPPYLCGKILRHQNGSARLYFPPQPRKSPR